MLFGLIFGTLLLAHISQAFRYQKSFYWVIIRRVTSEFWCVCHEKYLQSASIELGTRACESDPRLLAPLWISAFDYMLLARMVHFFVPSRSLFRIKASTFALILVSLDIIAFIIQLIGVKMARSRAPPAEQRNGIHV